MATTGDWLTDSARSLTPGGYYRFALLAPGNLTADAVSAFLATKGWDVRAIEGAPANLAAAIPLPATPFASAPTAWLMHATWKGQQSALPIADEQLVYGTIDVWQSTGSAMNWKPWAIGGAVALGAWLLWSNAKSIRLPAHAY